MNVARRLLRMLPLALLVACLAAGPGAAEGVDSVSSAQASGPEGYLLQGPKAVAQMEGEVTDAHLTCDQEGAVHLVWIAARKSIHYRVRTAEGWQPPEVVAESKARRTKLAAARVAARGGQVWVVYRRDQRGGRSRVIASRRTAEGWGERERLCETKVTLLPPAIHVGADGQVQAYWFVLIPPPSIVRNVEYELYVRRHSGEGWGLQSKVLERTVNITSPTIGFDWQDRAHLAWLVWFREAATGVEDLTTPAHYSFIHRVTSGEAGALRPPSQGPFIIIAPSKAALAAAIDGDDCWHGLIRAHPLVMGTQEDHFFYVTNRRGAWPSDVTPVVTRPGRSTGALLAGSLGERGVLLAWQEGATLQGFLVREGERGREWSVPIEGEAIWGAGAEDGNFHLLTARAKGRGNKRIIELLYYSLSPADATEGTSAETPRQ